MLLVRAAVVFFMCCLGGVVVGSWKIASVFLVVYLFSWGESVCIYGGCCELAFGLH